MENWKDLEIPRKTSKAYELKFTKDGSPLSISGWTIYFTLKTNVGDSDTNAKIKKDIINHQDAEGGICIIDLSTTDTDLPEGSYYYDIAFADTEGNRGILIKGRITITATVTTR